MNIYNSMPLTKQIGEIMVAIEKCGASIELTHAVTLAGHLQSDLEFLEMKQVALENDWEVPSDSDSFPWYIWTSYWRGCAAYEEDASRGRPISPCQGGGGRRIRL